MKINFFFPWNAYKFVFDKFARFSSSSRLNCRSENTENLHNISLDLLSPPEMFFDMRDEAWQWTGSAKSEIKLPMKIHANSKKKNEEKGTRIRRHFLNIKMMRDCWRKIFYNTHRYIMIIVVFLHSKGWRVTFFIPSGETLLVILVFLFNFRVR